MQNYIIYTDGSCVPNPGLGSFAYVILSSNDTIFHKAAYALRNTTNNIMELTAILEALKYFKEPTSITLYSDSLYCINSAIGRFNGKKNKNIINEIRSFNKYHSVSYKWVRGHSGIYWNEYVDQLAEKARINKKFQKP